MGFYKIGDIFITIDSEIRLNKYNIMEKFRYNDKMEKVVIYKIRISEPYILDEEKLIYKNGNIKIYDYGEKIFRIYGTNDLFGDYACVEIERDSSEYICNIYKGKEKAFYSTKQLLELLVMEDVFLKNKGIILHSSNVMFENKSVLFTAPSGTGKSTQAGLWNKVLNTKIINGDKTLIKKIDGKYFAMGIPFCGSSKICENEKYPIRIIVYLKQGNYNNIREISKSEAYKKIISEVTINIWDQEFFNKVSDIVLDLINSVKIIEFTCLPDEDAVKVLKDYIEGT